jgi:adenosine deaminase
VIQADSVHPVMRMVNEGLNVTLGTDDPSISQITLTNEYARVCEQLGMPQAKLKERILAAGKAAFMPDLERRKMLDEIKVKLI